MSNHATHTHVSTKTAIETEGQPTGEVYALGVLLPKPLHDELQKIAAAGGHTVTQLVGVAISEYVRDFRELVQAIQSGEVLIEDPAELEAKRHALRQQRRIKRISLGR